MHQRDRGATQSRLAGVAGGARPGGPRHPAAQRRRRRPLASGRTPDLPACDLPGCLVRATHRRPQRFYRTMERRRNARRCYPCPAHGIRSAAGGGHRRCAGSAGCRCGARVDGARSTRLRDARPLHARRAYRGMVRTPPAGADSPLYRATLAARDRTGRAARFHALPVRMATPDARDARRRTRRPRSRARSDGGFRGGSGGLGGRHPAGPPQGLFNYFAGRTVPVRQTGVDAPDRARPRCCRAGAQHTHRLIAAP